MKMLLAAFAALFLAYKLIFSPLGLHHYQKLQQKIIDINLKNRKLQHKNSQLKKQIILLQQNDLLLESYARKDLGLVKKGEHFYQW